jgi:S1-C subfamily serine protease
LERNTGVVATGTVKGSPAFKANILPGDVILKIGGEDVIDSGGFRQQLAKFAGQTVDIDLIRGDHPKTIRVTLNAGIQ